MPRLILALVASLLLHGAPLAVAYHFGHAQPLDIEMQVHTVEIGLEDAHPGAANVPPPAPTTAARTLSPPVAPQPAPPAVVHPEPRAPPAPSRARDLEPLPLPTVDTSLHEPPLTVVHPPRPHLLEPDELHAEAHPAAPVSDAGASPAPTALPTVASAASDLAPMVPRGALLTILVHADRVRSDPNAPAVRRLLGGISDWQDMLGGTDLDPLNDLDELLLAAANPTGAGGHPPDWFVLARGAHGDDTPLRRAVEAMSGGTEPHASAAPSPVHPPPLDGGVDLAHRPDAGVRSIWHDEANGVQVATFERYMARRSFVMLGGGVAAIAMPGQVSALLGAMAQRGSSPLTSAGDPRLAVLIEGEGLRNLISYNTWRGPFPVPTRASLGIFQVLDGGTPIGAVRLESNWQYDTPEEAQHALEMFQYSRGRWHVMITEQLGAAGGLNRLFAGAAASLMGIDIGAVESSIDALQFRTEGSHLTIHADLTPAQTAALLRASSLGVP